MKKITLSFVALAAAAVMANAQAPAKFNYQGIARSASGAPLATRSLGMRISIHENSVTGPVVYQETQNATTNAFGLYNVIIGAGTPVTGTLGGVSWTSGDKFIQIEVDAAGGTAYADLGTSQLLSVPYAMNAASAPATLTLTGNTLSAGGNTVTLPTGGSVSGTTNYVTKFTSSSAIGNSSIFDDGTSVGIGTTLPSGSNKLEVVASATTGAVGIRSTVGSPSVSAGAFTPAAIVGESTNTGIAGVSSVGIGVVAQTGSSLAPALMATNTSTAGGAAIDASVNGTGAAAILDGGSSGRALVTVGGRAGIGTFSPRAKVHIASPTADSMGLYVTSSFSGLNNITVLAENLGPTATTGAPIGVLGYALPSLSSGAGRGSMGIGGNIGTYGEGRSTSTTTGATSFGSYGVGYANGDAIGVYGQGNAYSTAGSGTKYGLYGVAGNGLTNWAGYFGGNVNVTGSIAKASGTFKIDHPLDPDNKYLYHSFVESPDMMNIYNGNVTTDGSGYATVTMPAYFDALNKDFRYQLTVIGTFAQAIVKEEMQGNTFRIQTSQPNVKVSWQVTGVREDAYANAHRVQPEVEKAANEKGKYIHPVELGKPASTEINYELNHPKTFVEDKASHYAPQSSVK